MTQKAFEYNFDGLIGPTHNFAGLARGNLASIENRYCVSHPRAAALQGLDKMQLLFDLGVPQGFIPPQERPNLAAIREHGFSGSDRDILDKAGNQHFEFLLTCSSASSMWTANAATISPSFDTQDKHIHITPANLASAAHRSIEPAVTEKFLRLIFRDQKVFVHHAALKAQGLYFDEGAANHMRICAGYGTRGVEVFVYGRQEGLPAGDFPQTFQARQSREASEQVIQLHQLHDSAFILARQNPEVIDQGVFHNDVIAVNNENVLLYHELAFANKTQFIQDIRQRFNEISQVPLYEIEISNNQLPVVDAVKSYLFNSQIVRINESEMALIAPQECKENGKVEGLVRDLIAQENPISRVNYVNLRESMSNGGGPACLRLRVVLHESQVEAVNSSFLLDSQMLDHLRRWIESHYREQLHINDLRDYHLLEESRQALDELTQILGCGSVYDFQKC